MGHLSDRYGRCPLISAGLVLGGVTLALITCWQNYLVIVALVGLFGLTGYRHRRQRRPGGRPIPICPARQRPGSTGQCHGYRSRHRSYGRWSADYHLQLHYGIRDSGRWPYSGWSCFLALYAWHFISARTVTDWPSRTRTVPGKLRLM